MKISKFLTLIVAASLFFTSCKETKISSMEGDESHNTGQNCMACHVSGGDGEGIFVAAGTVYDSTQTSIYANAVIKLYTEPNGAGKVEATLDGDALGNFYTTKDIDFGNGLYPSVTGTSGNVKYMSSSITMGQCNSCHGSSTGKIWTE